MRRRLGSARTRPRDEEEDQRYDLPQGGDGRPLVRVSAAVMSATWGEPSSRRSIVNVRVPGSAKISAKKIFPKSGTSTRWRFRSTPFNFVSIFSTREQTATPPLVTAIFPDFASLALALVRTPK